MLGRTLRGTGELLITSGVVVLLFVAYLLYWTDYENSRTQDALAKKIDQSWEVPAGDPGSGDDPTVPVPLPTNPAERATALARQAADPPLDTPIAKIYIQRIGLSRVVVQGTGTDQLDDGPGHVTSSVMAGEVGNFAVSGHRTTHGEPFNRLDEVHNGDHVVIEIKDAFITYTVVGEEAVDPVAGYPVVTDQSPLIGTQKASDTRLLTLTTCTPKFSAAQRLILRAVWLRTDAKADLVNAPNHRPPTLQPGVA